jgi:hypothetical protein
MNYSSTKRWIGIGAIAVAFCNSLFWAYWGITENFHEGWYFPAFIDNLRLMLGQYLSPFLISILVFAVGSRYPRIGSLLFFILGVFVQFYINNLVIAIPFLLIGLAFFIGKVNVSGRLIFFLSIIPTVIIGALGSYHFIRVSGRYFDGNFDLRHIEGNEVSLTWAPRGPGFPAKGVNWAEAKNACEFLSADGLTVMDKPQYIWRLPTVEECVRSFRRSNKNCGGTLDSETNKPLYEVKPDKESPLWDIYSPIIYYWTATEIDSLNAYIVVYDGGVFSRNKSRNPDYLGFRAVK